MALDILTLGEALVEVMRTDVNQPLNRPALFTGPYPSGAPFIFAVQSARLGMKTATIGAVGRDAFGECLLHQLDVDGVNRDHVYQLDEFTTGVAFVSYRDDGSRDFVFSLGAGGQLSKDMVNPSLFEGLRCLHLMGSTVSVSPQVASVCEHALSLAIENRAMISFDPNLRPELLSAEQAKHVFKPFMDAADILMPTAQELLLLSDKSNLDEAVAQLLSQKDDRIIVVTKGKQGCTVYNREGAIDVMGFPAEEIDPTGAGDCFDAGFLMGILQGKSLVDSARWANACGAFAVGTQGPMAGAKHHTDVAHLLT